MTWCEKFAENQLGGEGQGFTGSQGQEVLSQTISGRVSRDAWIIGWLFEVSLDPTLILNHKVVLSVNTWMLCLL